MLSASIFFHAISKGGIKFFLAAFALWALLKPSKLTRLCLLCFFSGYITYRSLPFVIDSYFFGVVIGAILLVTFYLSLDKKGEINTEDIFNDFAPPARLAVIVFYFWVVFHKLNSGFLDLASSCAVVEFRVLADKLPFIPQGDFMYYLAIYGTLLIEAAIPVFLVIPITRILGIITIFSFHWIIATNADTHHGMFYNFTSMLFALSFLFLPANFTENLNRLIQNEIAPKLNLVLLKTVYRLLVSVSIMVLIVISIMQQYRGLKYVGTGEYMGLVHIGFWGFHIYAVVLLVLFIFTRRYSQEGNSYQLNFFKSGQRLLYVFPLFLFLWGTQPYLGLRNQGPFNMFSNLKTGSPYWNHLIVPESMKIFEYPDLVKVVDMLGFGFETKDTIGWSFYNIIEEAKLNPERSMSYILKDQLFTVPKLEEDPRLRQSWIMKKALSYQPTYRYGCFTAGFRDRRTQK